MTQALRTPDRVVLVGPSGSGKSHLGRLLADALGFELIDTDAAIESRIGMTIDELFARFGEPTFRTIESEVLAAACGAPGRVIATGGGAVIAPANWAAMRPGAVIVGLTGNAETLVERVTRQQERVGRSAARPNMAGDPLERMRAMLATRGPLYRQADVVLQTDEIDIQRVLDAALAAIQKRVQRGVVPALSIETPMERSDLYVARGIRAALPELARARWPGATRAWVITDEHVAEHWLAETTERLRLAGYDTREIVVPPGESTKSVAQLGEILETMTSSGVSRSDVVVALGGGVIGDLAGFVAAICLRGLSLVQLPTSLLAMVDSSVGGKTAINTGAGKNMVGAFYQPGLVLVDTDYLGTLSQEEYRSGMAEVIKHSVIQPATPLGSGRLADLLAAADALDPIPLDRIDEVVLENVRTKHSVVQEDERESGLRMILNFGHTAGHAIEADGYRYRHGEAIGLGMLVATHIAISTDLCGSELFATLEAQLASAGLPTRYDGSVASVLENMQSDKKNIAGVQRWILPVGASGVEIRTGIDLELVSDALRAIGGS